MPRGRPPKSDEDKKGQVVRIPVTGAQKAAIAEAARQAGEEMAPWARRVLLAAANGNVEGAADGKRMGR